MPLKIDVRSEVSSRTETTGVRPRRKKAMGGRKKVT